LTAAVVFLAYLEQLTEPNGKGRTGVVPAILNQVQQEISERQDGIYYITQDICSTCFPFNVFVDIEQFARETGETLELILLGHWSKRDVDNLLVERNQLPRITLASDTLNALVSGWSEATGRHDFNLVVVKSTNVYFVLPLLSPGDEKQWYFYKNMNRVKP
jgi:hypothetical protein